MYFESKFVALENQKELVQEFLNMHLKNSDPYPQDRVYNLYFDTADLRSTCQAFSDDFVKRKFRLRLYDSTNQYSLQMKVKKNGLTEKQKMTFNRSETDPFTYTDWESLIELASESNPAKPIFKFESLKWGPLQPLVHVQYERRRFRIGDCRVTWDDNIRYISCDGFGFAHKVAEASHGILEIKSPLDHVPPFLIKGLSLQLKPTNISKFKSALTALKLLHTPFAEFERNDYGFKSII